MSGAAEVLSPQDGTGHTGFWQGISLIRSNCDTAVESPSARLTNGDVSSSGDELNTKVRKPYTITKQRERWTEDEHQKFLEALKLYGRAWRRIEEHIGSKTAVQIRSHAQKFFSKLEREASNGGLAGKLQDIAIPPPRPKRKPNHPYPRKAGANSLTTISPMDEESRASPVPCSAHNSAASSVPTAAFMPYLGKGGPFLDATILRSGSLESTHFLGPEGKLKLFGKTVLVPTSAKAGVLEECKEISIKGKNYKGSPAKERTLPASAETIKDDLSPKTGFVPYVKGESKNISSADDAFSLDMNASGSCISAIEGTDESIVENPCRPLAKVQCSGESMSEGRMHTKLHDSNLQNLSRRQSLLQEAGPEGLFPNDDLDQTIQNEASEARDGCANLSNKDCVPHTISTATNMNKWFSAMLAPQNNATYLWMDSLFRYYGNVPALPFVACGPNDGKSNSPNVPWHFLRAAAMVHPAAYAAAMATAGWTQIVSGGQTPASGDLYSVPASLDRVSASAFTAAAASWWAMRGLSPPGFVHPPAVAISKSADDPGNIANVVSGTFAQNHHGTVDDTVKQEQGQMSDPATDDESGLSENKTEPENTLGDDCREANKPGKDLGPSTAKDSMDICSSAIAAQVGMLIEGRKNLCETNIQHNLEEEDMFPKVHLPNVQSQEVEKAPPALEQAEQSPCSSADETDVEEKNHREGSSSGSNTPICRQHSSESETPHTSGSDVKGSDEFSKQHDTCDGATGKCYQENQSNAGSCPKMRFKHLEKGRKHQPKDLKHGDEERVKRFKSCSHDMDVRKEVSQEGRKAFQALFTSRTLPQTFSSVPSLEDLRNPRGVIEQDVLMDSATTVNAEGTSCVLRRSERDGSGYIDSCESLSKTVNNDQKELRQEAHGSGCANTTDAGIGVLSSVFFNRRDVTEKSVECNFLSISKEVDAKTLNVGSRLGLSGFVPYRRPLSKVHPNSNSAINKHCS